SASTNVNVSFSLVDGAGTAHNVTATKVNGFDIVWYTFTLTAPSTGACCKPDGTCAISSQTGCTSTTTVGGVVIAGYGGTYQGNGTPCPPSPCPAAPVGACCHDDGSCTATSSAACTSYTGAWHGAGSVCLGVACPGVIAGGGIIYDTFES